MTHKEEKHNYVPHTMEWLITCMFRRVVTWAYFEVQRAAGCRVFQHFGSINQLSRNGIHNGIDMFPENPAVICSSAPPPCGLPLPPLWCLLYYGTVVWKWMYDLRGGKMPLHPQIALEECMRRYLPCLEVEYDMSKTKATLAAMDSNSCVPVASDDVCNLLSDCVQLLPNASHHSCTQLQASGLFQV